MTGWNPELYLKFKNERTRPAYDLAGRIEIEEPGRIIDIGCGPGTSTKVLRERWKKAEILGLDSSPAMIEKAGKDYPEGEWVLSDIREWEGEEKYDLVFSNATIQWIGDHEKLLKKLFAMVQPGGALAVQIPANSASPLHRAVHEVADDEKWRDSIEKCKSLLTWHPPDFYYDILSGISERVDMWETIYYHIMNGHKDIIEWYESTGLRPYLENLPDEEAGKEFKERILEGCRKAYKMQGNGKVLFPFKRLFFVAYKKGRFTMKS